MWSSSIELTDLRVNSLGHSVASSQNTGEPEMTNTSHAHQIHDSSSLIGGTLLDTSSICDSDLPNRDPSSYKSKEFFELQRNIQQFGQTIPIKVRRLKKPKNGNPLTLYEVVFGHRRLHACRNLGFQVRAEIIHDLSDLRVLVERVSENSNRADFTALEFGLILAKALQCEDSGGQQGVAAAFGKDEGLVSKALQLARLPQLVIAAFESPADLQYRHGKPLTDALRLDYDAVLLNAAQLAEEPGPRRPADVLKRLTSLSVEPVEPFNRNAGERKLTYRGEVVVILKVDCNGIANVKLKRPLDDAGIEALEKALLLVISKSPAPKSPKRRDKAKEAP